MSYEELSMRIKDRYDVLELLELLELTMDEVLYLFEDRIKDKIEVLDV